VHPDLQAVVRAANAHIAGLGFIVTEGLRTKERQAELFASGASKTMNSRHLTGHAVDLAATVGGEIRWEMNLYYKLARAVRTASVAHQFSVTWGAFWGELSKVADNEEALANAVALYVARCKKAGSKPLIDGPHFELSWAKYP
jgi:peptidoglycan L-alanyl-D-glutamate endopeptidase CwlK